MAKPRFDPKQNIWILRHYYPRGGPQHIEREATPELCEAAAKRRCQRIDLEAMTDGDGTVGSLLEAWFEDQAKVRADDTVTSYRQSIAHLNELLGPTTHWIDITTKDLERAYRELVADGTRGPSTLARDRSHLYMALRWGVIENKLPAEVRSRLIIARSPEFEVQDPEVAEKRWLSLDEYEVMRQHLLLKRSTRDVLFMVMLLCGLRPGEARGLKWEYVDTGRRLIKVEGQMKRAKKGDVGERYTTRLKTDHRHGFAHREVPIPTDLTLVLAEKQRMATSEFVFVDDEFKGRSQGLVRQDAVGSHAKALALRTGVGYVNPYGYRHTFASVCRYHQMPYELLAQLMGHQDTKEIIETYGHPITNTTPSDMDRYLGGPPE